MNNEVSQGVWLIEYEPDGTPYQLHCSICDESFMRVGITEAYKYCPDCGAKMRYIWNGKEDLLL